MPRKRLPWIKLWFEMLGDPKMTRLTLAERGCWHELLLLAGQSPARGKLMLTETEPMTMDDIAKALSLTPDEYPVLESCVEKLINLNSLRWNEHNCLEVIHFLERQDKYPSDFEDYHKKSPDKLLINSEKFPEKLRKEEEGRGEGQKEDLRDSKESRVSIETREQPRKGEKTKPKQVETGIFLDLVEKHIGTRLVQRPKLSHLIRSLLVKFPKATPEHLFECFKWLKENDPYCRARDSPMIVSLLPSKYPEWAAGKLKPIATASRGRLPTGVELEEWEQKQQKPK